MVRGVLSLITAAPAIDTRKRQTTTQKVQSMSSDIDLEMGNAIGQEAIINVVRNRFEIASQKVLEHPKFDDDSRQQATQQLAAMMVVFDQALEASGGRLLTRHQKIVAPIIEYFELIDEFCADDEATHILA